MNGKLFKRISAVLMVAMLMAMTITSVVSAVPSSLPEPGREGSIIIHKFIMDDLSDATVIGNGLEVSDGDLPEGVEPLGGITFSVIRVKDDSVDAATALPYDDATEAEEATTDGDGECSFEDLDQGIYKVTEIANANVGVSVAPFLVSIPITDPEDGESWIYDVHVYPKNESLTIDKFVNESDKTDTANIGETVLWNIVPDVPADVADSKVYEVVDIIDTQLTYVGNAVVYGVDTAGEKTELSDENYTLTEPSGTTGGGTFKVTFNQAGRTAIAAYHTLSITFETFINSTADLGTPIYNGATLNYTNSSDDVKAPFVSEPYKPEVHTGGALLEKVAKSDNDIKLADAEFKVALTEEAAEDGVFLRMAEGKVLLPDDEGYDEAEDWVVTTALSTGQATFEGLAYGTYYVVETKAPKYDSDGDGVADKPYNLLKAPFAVTVNEDSHEELSKVVVENSKGFALPLTGGKGTIIFTIIGIALIISAVALLVKFKPKKAKK